MRVIATYIVKGIHGKETILYHSEDGKWFVLNNGALGENDGSLKEINPTRAHSLIKYMK
jgi:hypothetical protein